MFTENKISRRKFFKIVGRSGGIGNVAELCDWRK